MVILCIGDVVGTAGVQLLRRQLASLKKELSADLCVVNGENADPLGAGLPSAAVKELYTAGADVITAGNHALRRSSLSAYEEDKTLLCPANAYYASPTWGHARVDLGRAVVQVVDITGTSFLESARSPFETFDTLFASFDSPYVVVDFHGEATAEKAAFAHWVDGRASAVFGTHTHVPTADARVLPGGTGFVTDIGMTGPTGGVIGVRAELAIQRQRLHLPTRFEPATGQMELQGVLFQLDAKGRCQTALPVRRRYAEDFSALPVFTPFYPVV